MSRLIFPEIHFEKLKEKMERGCRRKINGRNYVYVRTLIYLYSYIGVVNKREVGLLP